jgi:Fe(3+) dicitrate transport protein
MTETILNLGSAMLQPLLDPASRTFVPYLLSAALILWVTHKRMGRAGGWRAAWGTDRWAHPSSRLDLQVYIARRLFGFMGLLPFAAGAWGLAVWISTGLDRWLGTPEIPTVSPGWLTLGYTLTLFVVWDLSRFLTHLAMHKIPLLWQFHQVHHSAEVLTPLTFHRIHPFESALYALRGTATTGVMAGTAYWMFRGTAIEFNLLGVHGLGVLFNGLTGNLRHSHAWIRFGASVERWLLSPAQHQLHHGIDPAFHDANFGTWLACWDRLLGSLQLAPVQPITRVGLSAANHDPHNLASALFQPILGMVKSPLPPRSATAIAAASLLLLTPMAATASAEPEYPGEEPDWLSMEDESSDETMVVTGSSGLPRIAGAAHIITEEELERHEYTDIHQVLASVPGVYLRGEDGYGLRPNIGLRGGNSDRSAKIALLEDGIPMAPAPYAAPAAYYFPMTMRLVGVEVIKGAAAIRHGPQTIGGAINLRTRRIPRDTTIGEVDVGLGGDHTLKAHGFTGHGTDRWGVLAEYARLSSDGFKELDGGGATGFTRQDAMLKARVSTDRSADVFHEIELKLGHGTELSHETYLGLTATDFRSTPDRRYAASAGDLMEWTRQAGSLTWRLLASADFDLRTTAYVHRLDREWTKLNGFSDGTDIHELLYSEPDEGLAESYLNVLRGTEDSTGADQLLLRGKNDRQFLNYGIASVGHWRFTRGPVENELELGVRWHSDDVIRLHTQKAWAMEGGALAQTDGKVETTLDSHNDAKALAIHIHDDLGIGPIRFLPGLRHEQITTRAGNQQSGPTGSVTHSIWLPGLGVYATPNRWLGLLAGANKGFSPIPPGSEDGSVPETAWNYEAGLRIHHRKSSLELIGFYSAYENLTGTCTLSGGCTDDQLDTQFNGGEAVVRGVETTAGQVVSLGHGIDLDLDVAYAWTDGRFSTDFVSQFPQFGNVSEGDQLPYVPMHQGSAGLALLHEAATLSAKASGRSGMRDIAGSDDEPRAQAIQSIIALDMGAEYRLSQHLALYGTATNLTGQRTIASWRPFGARPNAPTRWMVGIKGRL